MTSERTKWILDQEATYQILIEVAQERKRQDAKWGEQNHLDGTGADEVFWAGLMSKSKTYAALATRAKQTTDDNAKTGTVTFADILLEEVFEALAEKRGPGQAPCRTHPGSRRRNTMGPEDRPRQTACRNTHKPDLT